MNFVLSIFPGIGILDRAFEEEGFTVVRGPDLLWGGNIKRFHPPGGKFDGIIGGPPCQMWTRLVPIIRKNGYKLQEDLIPEFERIVLEAYPVWFVMENVEGAPIPNIPGYKVDPTLLDNRWLGQVQSRRHRFSFGTRDGRKLNYELAALEAFDWDYRVCASDFRRTPIKTRKAARARYRIVARSVISPKSVNSKDCPPIFSIIRPSRWRGKFKPLATQCPCSWVENSPAP